MNKEDKERELIDAAKNNDIGKIKELLADGLNVSCSESVCVWVALRIAMQNNYTEIEKLLRSI